MVQSHHYIMLGAMQCIARMIDCWQKRRSPEYRKRTAQNTNIRPVLFCQRKETLKYSVLLSPSFANQKKPQTYTAKSTFSDLYCTCTLKVSRVFCDHRHSLNPKYRHLFWTHVLQQDIATGIKKQPHHVACL